MDAAARREIVEELCSFEGRLSGTDAERRAAKRLAERLREAGRRAELEPIHVHPQYGLVHAAHCLLGFAGSLIAIRVPALGFALVLLAATSIYLDLEYRTYLVRRLFFRRASQNVVSPGKRADAPARLILTAHYDAARTGAAFDPKRARRAARLGDRLPFAIGPFRVLFWSLALLLPLLGARMAGVESMLLSLVQLLPTLVLLVGAFALVDIELSPVVPGAGDNAAGVAAALSVADELRRKRAPGLDVWIVLSAGGECQQEGMRAFLRAHRDELDAERTWFLDLNAVGGGEVRYETAAGWVVSTAMSPRMVELSEAIATADAEGERRLRAAPLRHGVASDSLPPRLRGHRAIGITCRDRDGVAPRSHLPDDTPANLDDDALTRAHDFALELARRIGRDAQRRR